MYERWLILVQRYALLLYMRGFTDIESKALAALAASYTLDPAAYR